MGCQIQVGRIAEAAISLNDLQSCKSNNAAGRGTTAVQLVPAIGDGSRLSNGDSVVLEVCQGHGTVSLGQGGNGGVGDGAGIKGVSPLLGNNLKRVGVALASDGLAEPDQ